MALYLNGSEVGLLKKLELVAEAGGAWEAALAFASDSESVCALHLSFFSVFLFVLLHPVIYRCVPFFLIFISTSSLLSSISLFIYLSIYLFIYLSIYPSIHIYLSIYLSIYPHIYLSI